MEWYKSQSLETKVLLPPIVFTLLSCTLLTVWSVFNPPPEERLVLRAGVSVSTPGSTAAPTPTPIPEEEQEVVTLIDLDPGSEKALRGSVQVPLWDGPGGLFAGAQVATRVTGRTSVRVVETREVGGKLYYHVRTEDGKKAGWVEEKYVEK